MVRFIIFLFVFYSYSAFAAPFRVALEVKPPPETLYLGQEVFFELKLLDRIGLTDVRIVPKDWQNVDIFLDSENNEETVVRNDTSYSAKSFYFSLIPKSAGPMSLLPFCLSASAPTMISTRDLPPDVKITDSGRLEICASSFFINVKTLPYHSPALFAAAQVELFEGVVPKTRSIRQGSPIKRSLVLTAKGTLPNFLPDFENQEQKEVRVYKGKTERTTIFSKRNVISAVRQTIVFIPERAGQLDLPEINIFWLNTVTDKIEKSTIPAYRLTVLPVESLKPENTLPEALQIQPEEKRNFSQISVRQISGLFLGLFSALVFSYHYLRKHLRQKHLIKAVETACMADDLKKTEQSLLLWAKAKFPHQRIMDLSDIRRIFAGKASDFTAALDELELFLYGTGRFAQHLPGKKHMLARKLWQTFYKARQTKTAKKSKRKKYLPDLYPDS